MKTFFFIFYFFDPDLLLYCKTNLNRSFRKKNCAASARASGGSLTLFLAGCFGPPILAEGGGV